VVGSGFFYAGKGANLTFFVSFNYASSYASSSLILFLI
jgi:hypothetical protein